MGQSGLPETYRDEVYAASVRYVLPVSSRLRVMTIHTPGSAVSDGLQACNIEV